MNEERSGKIATLHAPAERAGQHALRAARDIFFASEFAAILLDAMPETALVLNADRQILAVNRRFLEVMNLEGMDTIMGARPGEAVRCVYANTSGGCGTDAHCRYCGAVNAVMECLRTRSSVTRECQLLTEHDAGGGALNFEVRATHLMIDDNEYVIVALRDISAEKRRRLLESIFFHDVINTASGIRMIAELMESADERPELMEELKQTLSRLSAQMVEELSSQQDLLAAERGDLRLNPTPIDLNAFLRTLHASYRHHHLAQHCTFELGAVPEGRIVTDATILRRVLDNLIRNALEATPPGGTASISAEAYADTVIFRVHNPGMMSEEVRHRIFQRAFTTKSGRGHGMGTYSVKLLTERYLGGRVTFSSREPDGTTFMVTVPGQGGA